MGKDILHPIVKKIAQCSFEECVRWKLLRGKLCCYIKNGDLPPDIRHVLHLKLPILELRRWLACGEGRGAR